MMKSKIPAQPRQTWRKALQILAFAAVMVAAGDGMGIPNLWHSHLARWQLEKAASSIQQQQAFSRIHRLCTNYEIRVFDEAGTAFRPVTRQDCNRVVEVQIRFADGGVIRTKLMEPGNLGVLLRPL